MTCRVSIGLTMRRLRPISELLDMHYTCPCQQPYCTKALQIPSVYPPRYIASAAATPPLRSSPHRCDTISRTTNEHSTFALPPPFVICPAEISASFDTYSIHIHPRVYRIHRSPSPPRHPSRPPIPHPSVSRLHNEPRFPPLRPSLPCTIAYPASAMQPQQPPLRPLSNPTSCLPPHARSR